MSKSKSKRKQQAQPEGGPAKKTKTNAIITPPPDGAEPKTLQSVGLHEDDLEIAIDTLNTLAENPSVIKSKACKDLRTAVYEFRQACTTGFNASGLPPSHQLELYTNIWKGDTNLTARVSGALADGGYIEARIMLAEMRIRNTKPKLGALCRWVRDLDVVSGLSEQLDAAGPKRTSREEQLLVVLDAVLRLTGPIDYSTDGSSVAGPIDPRKEWDLRGSTTRGAVYDSVMNHSIFKYLPTDIKPKFRIIESTPGLQRKPPNLHPAILHTSEDDVILLSSENPKATHHTHPVVPDLHLLKDVLSPNECTQIIAAGETIGFTPDAPIRGEGEESSVLAHNFYWIVDTAFCAKLWSRVKEFVPAAVGGKKVRGLNRRFRVYRYVPGAEYRAHIDGAWPPSAIDLTNDTYIYDSSPPEAKQSSLFTFLIYLNDEFEGGETTFFLPSAREGTMNAYPVKPIQGSVAMFPHGETEGSLLHEGTGVRKGINPSAKYVIRTDVLYDVDT
ncbi:hypothetical protein D0Z07_7584 [Hyphodiscus hymeniophilus]|uniref:Fe2OG dioxygenase domain-containing protein n=1 Tax=Hyphodiscus hymeniophilus TaxID=353542 RepID=A0A9P6VER0_9HELO|nr:hypothetical protein D0Z07_7584 [Hyphodiscus hymeniophilus]